MELVQENRLKISAGIAIGPILFVVAILAVLVAAIASGSGGFGSSTASESARVRAGSIMQQAINIKNAVDRMSVNGEDPTTIVTAPSGFTSTSTKALYGTAGGGITVQNPPPEAIASGATWRFVRGADMPQIGGTGGDFITVLSVTLATCNALNDIIFGRGVQATPPSMGTTPTVTIAATGTGDTVTPSGNVFTWGSSPSTAPNGRTAACVTDGTNYYFYQLLTAG